ncbi:MAG: hypothetical protein IPP82_02180 [Xanthomonadales bacterium]|nr:hypothetical protein [Xanthomonadales bacterium]
MTVSLRKQWQHFKAMPCGRRFQTRHRMRRAKARGALHGFMLMGGGFLLVIAGIAMLVLPGPGLLTIVIGAALIAEESLVAARLLDRVDSCASMWLRRWRAWRQRRKQARRNSR